MDLVTLKGMKKNAFSSQSVSSDLKNSEESLYKKADPYKIRMTKNKGTYIIANSLVFSKKGSISSTKCTVLKSK